MPESIMFQSKSYAAVDWADTLNQSIILSNKNLVLIPKILKSNNKFLIISPEYSFELLNNDLNYIENNFLDLCNINLAKIDYSKININIHDSSNLYIKQCTKIALCAIEHIKKIFDYTYDHLLQRTSNKINIIKLQVIQKTFAEIICDLNLTNYLLSNVVSIQMLSTAFNYLLKVLHLLAQLGGGRSMLKGNAVELIFHLQVFQSIFLNTD